MQNEGGRVGGGRSFEPFYIFLLLNCLRGNAAVYRFSVLKHFVSRRFSRVGRLYNT